MINSGGFSNSELVQIDDYAHHLGSHESITTRH